MEYMEVDRARMEPDVYDGPNFNQHRPRWIIGIEKEGDCDVGGTLEIQAKNHPPGTQVVIIEPLCPKCGEVYENCMVRGYGHSSECDFDWKRWAEEQYS